MKNTLSKFSALATFCATALLTACGGGGGDAGIVNPGTLHVSLTDAPSCGYDAVNVTVRQVRVHQSANAGENDAGWTDITLNPARKINLLNLTNGTLTELGETPLAAGHYTQLRLVLDPNSGTAFTNSVILSADPTKEFSLDTPSAVQSGIKLNSEFDVAAGQRADVLLDFDACKSIVTKGNGKYALKPVVKVVPIALNGINGFISPANRVTVSAQQNGVIVGSTVPNSTTGEFYLARLTPGTYDVVITADGRAASVISSVPVASATSTTSVSTSSTPIVLQTAIPLPGVISGVVTLTPASSTEAPYVAAQQTFQGGSKVTVKYRFADMVTGEYALTNLPTVAPLLGKYDGKLPVAFAQSNTTPGTGMYSVEASAAGYASKTISSVDITTVDAVNVNFSLK